jgi:hypothetical protein
MMRDALMPLATLRRSWPAIGGLLVLAVTQGCAFGSRQVNLLYGLNATGESGTPASESRRVAVALFADARKPDDGTGTFLGRIRNTYGIPTASVYAKQDPVIWVSEGIARGLAARGYTVERVASSRTADDLPAITGAVTKVTSGMYANIEAHVEADVALERAGHPITSQHCSGATLQSAGSISAAVYEQVFLQTMNEFLRDCIPKLVTMIESRSAP